MDWSVDQELGLIQGPLDLEFMRGKRMLLALEQGQYALLVGDNSLKAVYLEGGKQSIAGTAGGGLTYGQSVTDACIDWDTTERLLLRAQSELA